MDFTEIREADYRAFHQLANAYYREGEDSDTPQEVMDSFIRMMFEQVITRSVSGCFLQDGGQSVGFVLWAVDSEDFAFREMPGYGTILEIGLIPSYRSSGLGKNMVAYVEEDFRKNRITQCYVSAYGPAQKFWASCGYVENGLKAANGLPIMTKTIL